MKEVSVVIPTYNAGKYIADCINSVLEQDYPSIEVIVVDDCSTDNTRDILSKYDSTIVRYICLESNFGGPAKPRNVGVMAALGQYIVMLDADDLLINDSIEQRINILKADKELACVFCDGKRFSQRGNEHLGTFLSQHKYFNELIKNYTYNTSIKFSMLDAYRTLAKGDYILPSGLLVRRNVFDSVGWYDESITNGQDADMSLRITMSYPIAFLNIIGFKQRVHDSSISAQGYKLINNKIILLKKNLARNTDSIANDAFKQKIAENYLSLAYHYRTSKEYKLASKNYANSLAYSMSLKAMRGWLISMFLAFF